MLTRIKTTEEIKAIRTSGKMLATVLDVISKEIEPGMNGKDIDKIAVKELNALGGKPAFYKYEGFPNTICISINQAVVHGIPTTDEFKKGDVIGFDFGVNYQGMITDSAITLIVGGSDDKEVKRLVSGTKEALMAGIGAIKGPTHVGDISAAVEEVMNRNKFGIIRELVGHGVGHQVHEEPNIPNYGTKGSGMLLQPGMTIAIEPMSTLGKDDIKVEPDGWTISSADGTLTAHFEHTVLVTKTGSEIITKL